jgi:hypothetical protein
MPTVWLIMGALLLVVGAAFSSMGFAVIAPVLAVSTVAAIVAVYIQT